MVLIFDSGEGEDAVVSHTWNENGTYTIRAKAKDIHGEESDWATSTVSTTKNKQSTNFLESTGEEINNNEWKIITMKGKCDSWSCGTILHFFSIWATPQPMRFYQVTEDMKIKINGELYPIEGNSSVLIEGFVGKAFFPLKWIIYEKQEIEPPHDITVFGFCKYIEVATE